VLSIFYAMHKKCAKTVEPIEISSCCLVCGENSRESKEPGVDGESFDRSATPREYQTCGGDAGCFYRYCNNLFTLSLVPLSICDIITTYEFCRTSCYLSLCPICATFGEVLFRPVFVSKITKKLQMNFLEYVKL